MKTRMLFALLVAISLAGLVQPVAADDRRPPGQPPADSTTQDDDKDKDKKLSDKEKLRLEVEARREIQKKEWLEDYDRRHGRHHPQGKGGGDVIIVTDPGGGTGGGGGTVYTTPYRPEREQRSKSTAGILYAPAQRDKEAGFGIQWLGPRKIGATLWISGDLGYGDDVIAGSIPHNDYWVDEKKGTYGLEAICGFGSDNAMLILGAGLAVRQTYYTAVSNVTGWEWEDGTDSEVVPAGHASLQFRIADRVNMQFGYDSTQYAFFGLSASF